MMKQKLLFCICFCLTLAVFVQGQSAIPFNKLYVVRHAEKDTGSNPVLSQRGYKRAGDLYRELKQADIDLVLVSQYRRTGLTADSLRFNQHIEVMEYKADATGESVANILATRAGKFKNVLVVGHSNTLAAIIHKLGAANYPLTDVPDHEYDNLYIVENKNGVATVSAKKYGEKSVLKNGTTEMKISQ